MRRVIWIQTPKVFWLGGGTISLSYWMYMGLIMFGRQKYTAEPLVPELSAFEVELANEKLNSHQSRGIDEIPAELRQGVEQFALRSINLLFLFGIRRNCLRSGRSRSLCLSIRRAIKHIVVIIGVYHFVSYLQSFIQYSAIKVNCICRRKYWGSSVWISTQQINYWSYILHS